MNGRYSSERAALSNEIKKEKVSRVTIQVAAWKVNAVEDTLDSVHAFFFFQAEDGIRDVAVTGVQTCALPIFLNPVFLFTSGSAVIEPLLTALLTAAALAAVRGRLKVAALTDSPATAYYSGKDRKSVV